MEPVVDVSQQTQLSRSDVERNTPLGTPLDGVPAAGADAKSLPIDREPRLLHPRPLLRGLSSKANYFTGGDGDDEFSRHDEERTRSTGDEDLRPVREEARPGGDL